MEQPVALCVAARLGAGGLRAGSYGAHRRRGTDRGLPAASAAGVGIVPGAAICPMAAGCRMLAAWSWMASVGRCGQLDSWRPSCPRRTVRRSCSGIGGFLTRAPRQHWDRSTTPRRCLPPSADYWEVKETKPTLATAAVLCAGLEAGAELYRILGDVARRRPRRSRRASATRRDQVNFRKERLSAASRRPQRQHRPGSRFSAAACGLKR